MPDAILGLDLGTTAVKLGLFALEDGRQLALATREYPLETPHEHWAELAAPVYWESIVAGMAELRATAPGWRVASIGLSSQGQTFVCLDETDRPLRPAIVWLDTRAGEQCQRLLAALGPDAYRRQTGLAFPQPISSAPKLRWIAENEPDVWQRTRHVAMLPEYIGHRLTGQYVCDPCNLSTTGLYSEHGWWHEAMALTGVSRDLFGEVRPTGQPIGATTPDAARALGIESGIPVGVGSNDQLTGAVAVGNVRPGILSGAIGTAMAIVATLPPGGEKTAQPPSVPSHPHPVPDRRYALTFAMTTGILLRWYRDRFGRDLDYPQLVERAMRIAPGADGLTLLPHFSGTATPTFDATVRGALLGLSLQHGPDHLVRAILEAVGFTVRDAVELLHANYRVSWQVLRVLGGATRSPAWMQLIADVTGIPIEKPVCSEAAVFGGALCGAVAANLLPSLADAGERFYKAERTYEPGPDSARYEAPYRRYRQAMATLYPEALGI